MTSATILDPETPAPLEVSSPEQVPAHVKRTLIKGSAALGGSVSLERGMGFIANILAARFGGAATFGAYSLAISTANNISTYAGGGIGSTAARFSGKYPRGSSGYATLARVLIVVSLISALVAAGGLWAGAAPIARLLHKPVLTELLRWTGISAVGIILLECARGFFIGQGRLAALILLSVAVGTGMMVLIPYASRAHSPTRMIVFQGIVTTSAVLACFALARPLQLVAPASADRGLPFLPMLREVWAFGFIQLAGLIGVNFAGWWLTTLVARADTSLVQMSFFAIASQLRNIAGLAPSMLTESSYAVMADPEAASSTPHSVMALCTFASTSAAFLLASIGIILAPWALKLIYGRAYTGAAMTVAIGLCVAVVHMGNAPAAARLSIVSIRSVGVINTVWAVFVAVAATALLFHGGSAWEAMTIYLAGHALSSTLVFVLLAKRDFVPRGMIQVFAVSTAAVAALGTLACMRTLHPSLAAACTAMMLLIFAGTGLLLWFSGRRHSWLPSRTAVQRLVHRVLHPLRSLVQSEGSRGN